MGAGETPDGCNQYRRPRAEALRAARVGRPALFGPLPPGRGPEPRRIDAAGEGWGGGLGVGYAPTPLGYARTGAPAKIGVSQCRYCGSRPVIASK